MAVVVTSADQKWQELCFAVSPAATAAERPCCCYCCHLLRNRLHIMILQTIVTHDIPQQQKWPDNDVVDGRSCCFRPRSPRWISIDQSIKIDGLCRQMLLWGSGHYDRCKGLFLSCLPARQVHAAAILGRIPYVCAVRVLLLLLLPRNKLLLIMNRLLQMTRLGCSSGLGGEGQSRRH